MRLVIQRVLESSVRVDGEVVGQIGKGFMVLCGVEEGDTLDDVRYGVEKTAGLRIFEDDAGKMNRSIIDVGGEILTWRCPCTRHTVRACARRASMWKPALSRRI